uniref:Uncharacterized protein n=1 Tax=Anguilla anguilla TaxID=7936 RepID=A0A0E9VF59_ANGAN
MQRTVHEKVSTLQTTSSYCTEQIHTLIHTYQKMLVDSGRTEKEKMVTG